MKLDLGTLNKGTPSKSKSAVAGSITNTQITNATGLSQNDVNAVKYKYLNLINDKLRKEVNEGNLDLAK